MLQEALAELNATEHDLEQHGYRSAPGQGGLLHVAGADSRGARPAAALGGTTVRQEGKHRSRTNWFVRLVRQSVGNGRGAAERGASKAQDPSRAAVPATAPTVRGGCCKG